MKHEVLMKNTKTRVPVVTLWWSIRGVSTQLLSEMEGNSCRGREVGWTLGVGCRMGMLAVSPMNQVGSPAVYNFGPHIVSPEFIYLFFSGKSLHVLNMC